MSTTPTPMASWRSTRLGHEINPSGALQVHRCVCCWNTLTSFTTDRAMCRRKCSKRSSGNIQRSCHALRSLSFKHSGKPRALPSGGKLIRHGPLSRHQIPVYISTDWTSNKLSASRIFLSMIQSLCSTVHAWYDEASQVCSPKHFPTNGSCL